MPKSKVDLNAKMNADRDAEEEAMRASLKPQKPPARPPKKKNLNAEMNKKRASEEASMRKSLLPDQLIAPNSSMRGKGACQCGQGGRGFGGNPALEDDDGDITVKKAWGSAANGNYNVTSSAKAMF